LGVEGARERLRRLQGEALAVIDRFGQRAATMRQAVAYVAERTS